jgi:hypothetical protein
MPTVDPATGRPRVYLGEGRLGSTRYDLSTDRLGTQLDPPAHRNPYFPRSMSCRPRSPCVRWPSAPFKTRRQETPDIRWTSTTSTNGSGALRLDPARLVRFHSPRLVEGLAGPALATRTQFPGVKLSALKFLHLERHILFHGHETLDTDTAARKPKASPISTRFRRGPARHHSIPEIARRDGRLRALHRDLSAGLELWRVPRRSSRSADGAA